MTTITITERSAPGRPRAAANGAGLIALMLVLPLVSLFPWAVIALATLMAAAHVHEQRWSVRRFVREVRVQS